MECILSIVYSILLNGSLHRRIHPSGESRQENILGTEVFSQMLIKAEKDRKLDGAKIITKGPNISYLFFADDSFVFCKAQR